MGCYVEFILNKRVEEKTPLNDEFLQPKYNMINQTVLTEFNKLFDSVLALRVDNITFSDLCPRRFGMCSIEGGLMRTKKFQKNFLAHDINVAIGDTKETYVDPGEADAVNFPLTFGKFIKLEKRHSRLHLVHTSKWFIF